MPELPEVETVRRGLVACLRGARLRAVTLRRGDLRWTIPARAVRDLEGRRLLEVERRAKYLLLRFSGPGRPVALVHLGMSGRLYVDAVDRRSARAGAGAGGAAAPPWAKHEHWRMEFAAGLLRYGDARRFGVLDVAPRGGLGDHELLARLGPEPLGDGFDGERIFRGTRRRTAAIKTWLMDARNVVGVGNIYASEACYRAGVRPTRAAGRTTRVECQRLAGAVRSVLRAAIRAGGTTLRDYIGVDRSAGEFQVALAVYGRDGEPCATCGQPVKCVVLGGRSTYYCPRCQR